MAGNAVIGALRVVLGADTAALETGLKDARSSLASFGASAGAVLTAAGAAMAAGLTAATYAVKKQIDSFDDLSKTSQKIGVPVEQLSALRYAAQLSDVSSEALTKGLGKLARSAVDAAQGSTTAVAAYRALGISFRDSGGNIKQVGDLLPQIADRFAAMKDGTTKTALAMQIFGKAGADMIPLLNSGGAGLREMTTEAAAFGLVIDQNTGRAAEAFNDNLTRLGKIFEGLVTQVTAQMLPTLLQFNQMLLDFAKNGELVKTAASGIVAFFKALAEEAIKTGVIFHRAAADLYAFANVVDKFFGTDFGALKKAWADFNQSRDDTAKAYDSMGKVIAKFNEDATKGFQALGEQTKKTFSPTIIKTTKDALDSFLDSKNKQIAAFQAEASTIGQSNIVQQQAKIVAEGLAAAQANHIPITEALRQKLQQLAETWSTWNERAVFGKQVFEQTRTPAEQFAATMERLNLAFDYGKANQEVYARGVAQAQQQLVQATPELQAFEQAAESAFGKALDGTLNLKDALKDLLKTLAMQQFKNLLLGTQGGSSGGVLGSLAGGGGGIGSVIGGIGKLFGFANGGSFGVGGSGGIDSQLVAFRASPNETVSVTKPGQGIGGGFVFAPVTNIDASGSSMSEAKLGAILKKNNEALLRQVNKTYPSRALSNQALGT
ncbi:hypothetical protein ASD45_08560 [Pseudolabrys sp. Root1462]|uniref:hypothetical protein n=1 Tax=Pseudolabrys sp. Root1462 TaxID=1736466 RepID=UPI00070280D0|nr:hypothetical protein [Pseudolabrys sp. Root1462]KQZ00905.1 hypothetical protein ASD45_08560 [Pseudolabrys sp. Root1462]